MQITLEALNKALAPIEDLGRAETTFEVNGVPITLQLLTPEQEVETQRYAREAFQVKEDDASAGQNYIERLRIAVLSHSIIAIGNQSFRDVQYVETGDKLENGTAIKKPLATVMRELILKQRWSGDVRMRMFAKYGELIRQSEKTAEAAIEYEPSDIDAEIERLEQRLAELKQQKEEIKETSSIAAVAKAVIQDDKNAQRQPETPRMRVEPQAEQPPQPDLNQVVPPNVRPRQSVVPTQAAPPPSAPAAAPQTQTAPVVQSPPMVEMPPDQYPDQAEVQHPDMGSFFDPEDTESRDDAVARENARLIAQRQGRPLPEPLSVLAATQGRRPPHANAKAVADEVFKQEGDVFRRPAETLGTRKPEGGPQRVPVNAPQKNVGNPRFQPPTRR